MNALSLDTVVLADNKKEMIILDQTLLPGEIKYLTLSKAEDIWEAIYALRVRGAPAIGVAAGYCGGIVDGVITAISNVFQGLPGMVLMIALVGVLERGTRSIILALVITSWVGFSRLVRGEVMKVKSEMYVEGMRCLGAGHLRIVLRHVLPNIRTNVILQFTTRVGRVVLSVAGLSYLGLGIEPPTPDWGEMVSGTARRYFRSAPHLLWAPGICIILLTLSINLLGDLLRDRLDVKQDAVKEL